MDFYLIFISCVSLRFVRLIHLPFHCNKQQEVADQPMSSTIPSDYPLTNILHPGVNDILCGRGGATNAHPGNIKFRKLVAAHKLRYLAATKCDKPAVAKDVVREWRAMDPPGRFLAKMDSKSDEVGGGERDSLARRGGKGIVGCRR